MAETEALIDKIRKVLDDLPGVKYSFTQPIDMRVSELISGTRGDLAVKIFGPDMGVLERVGQQVRRVLDQVAAQDARAGMAVVIDTLKGRPRHPEKQNRAETPLLRKPEWLRVRAPGSPGYNATREIVKGHGLVTVCEEAHCPNIGECWNRRALTIMILGDICTRSCKFCDLHTLCGRVFGEV